MFHEAHAVIIGASACRLIRVAGVDVDKTPRGQAARDEEGTDSEKGALRRHGELLGRGGVARSAERKALARGLV